MQFTTVIGLFAALGGLTSALPHSNQRRDGGGVDITNNMQKDIYLWSVSDTTDDKMITLNAGGTYSESWRTNPDGGGISIKMAMQPEQKDVLQYEYTLQGDTIFWDLSCIDMDTGSAFTTAGFDVSSNDGNCPSASCAPGDSNCADAYLFPTDDHATHGCPSGTQMSLNIGSGSSSGGGGGSSTPSPSASSSASASASASGSPASGTSAPTPSSTGA